MVAPVEHIRHRAGRASLEVRLVSGESAVTSNYATSPLKLLTPRARGQSVWAYTSSFGGGLVAGDETRLDLRLGTGTTCFLGTQASTKIYRNPARRPCGHATHARLGPDSLLLFAPDSVQAFADSRYTQHQEFQLSQGAGLALVDWFSSGRSACGERWEFSHFASRNQVFVDDQCVLFDSLQLDPNDGSLDAPHRTGRFNCVAVLALIGAPLREASADLLKEISARPVERRAVLVCSASPVREGVLLRVAGESVEQVESELHHHLQRLTALLGDDPWSRKW